MPNRFNLFLNSYLHGVFISIQISEYEFIFWNKIEIAE